MKTSQTKFDALVVGGGPAGAGFATWLAKTGLSVALLERTRFPRDKACGEFLTPQAKNLLTDLGVWPDALQAGAQTVRSTVLYAPNGNVAQHKPADGQPTGYTMRRVVLDSLLLENAKRNGVHVRENFAVRTIQRNDSGAIVGIAGQNENGEPEEIGTRLLIGADGSHSLVARQAQLVRALPRLQRVAVVSHWRNVPGDNDTIEMRAAGPLVCGMGFPGPDGSANLTFVVPNGMAPRIAGRPGDFIEETLERHFPDLYARLASAERETNLRTVGCFGHVCKPACADGILLVGDAATFIDPFTGEGVYFALRGAQRAAEVAASALSANDVSFSRLSAYARARTELARRYLLCDLVQHVVRTPALLSLVVQRLKNRADVAERLLSILGDTRQPTAALHPAFLWRLLAPEL